MGPVSAYGKTKLEGENFVKEFADHYFILRTAWLYGDGKNFIKTMLRLSETHDQVSVVMDQVGSPTSAEDATVKQRFSRQCFIKFQFFCTFRYFFYTLYGNGF